jgi:hypothetical protein
MAISPASESAASFIACNPSLLDSQIMMTPDKLCDEVYTPRP